MQLLSHRLMPVHIDTAYGISRVFHVIDKFLMVLS